jgi:SOS-response transcriptional repressor LexA
VVLVACDRRADAVEGRVVEPLTDRQREVLDLIATGVMAGNPPTFREMAGTLGFASTNAVTDFIEALERKGALRPTQERRPRRYDLTDDAWKLLGYERCGHCGSMAKEAV